jgi:beta-N-acetylhexosaminidase
MKLGKLIIDIDGIELSGEDIEILRHPYIGGVILFARNFSSVEQIISLIKNIKSIRSPSLITYVDQEGGNVQRFKDGFTLLPSLNLLGNKYINDPFESIKLSEELGWLIGYELSYVGIDVNTAPVLDIDYGRSNVMNMRCFSDNPNNVTSLSEAYIIGAKKSGISSICKHYPGHGYAKTDSHVELPLDTRGFEVIYKEDLMPYKRAIDLNIEGIMTSHVLYKNVDQYPPTISEKWLQILRNDLRYKGLIYSDDLSMMALNEFGEMEDNVLKSLSSGCNCIFICNDRDKVMQLLDNIILDSTEEESNKIMKLSNNIVIDNIYKNKKRLEIIGNLEKISEKKQIEINL